jgi:hypothetical protein
MEQDVDLSAVSEVVDLSSADGRQQCRSNGWQRTLKYGSLDPVGSRQQPSGYQTRKSEECRAAQYKESNQSALKTMRRTRARGDLHGAVESKKRVARRTCAGFCLAVRRQTQILRPYPDRLNKADCHGTVPEGSLARLLFLPRLFKWSYTPATARHGLLSTVTGPQNLSFIYSPRRFRFGHGRWARQASAPWRQTLSFVNDLTALASGTRRCAWTCNLRCFVCSERREYLLTER